MFERIATAAKDCAEQLLLRARWVFPVAEPPLENATVEIVEGKIAGVTRRHAPKAIDLGNCAIIPGLVNAHGHLELSDTESPLTPATPFTAWLRAVMAHRRSRTVRGDDSHAAIDRGAREAAQSGTTLLGDIVAGHQAIAGESSDRLCRIAFHESIGLAPDRIEPQIAAAREHLRRCADSSGGTGLQWFLPGLSPHAPYSVHPDLFAKLVDLARDCDVPLAMHLAETRAELELLEHGSGEFVTFLSELGVWNPAAIPRGLRPLDYLRKLAPLAHSLVIHGNYLSADEIEFLAGNEAISVVYCPRTHAYFGHKPHPWREMRVRGVNVALGTDSRASNPDLSLWNELRFLRRQFPDVDPAELMELGTIRGARALGQGEVTGALIPGLRGDLAIVTLPCIDTADPFQALFHPVSHVTGSLCGGRWQSAAPSVD